jgi:hypothetical protein
MASELEETIPVEVDQQPQRRATLLFVRMWAVAHILHLLIADRNALDTPWNVAVVALALAVLLRPLDGRLLAAMLVAQLVEYAVEMPFSPDHWALVSFVNVALLCSMAARRSTTWETVAIAFPAVRAILLIAYGAAALSKWNSTFLDPVTSCANAIAKVVTFGLVGPLGDSGILSTGAAITESAVFLCLLIPRTRCWGVLLGLGFHLSLSASPVMVVGDFTSTVYALFLLFLAPEVTARALDRITRWANRSRVVRDARRRPVLTAVVAFAALGLGGHLWSSAAGATLYVLEQFYFVTLLLCTAAAVLEHRRGARLGAIRAYHLPVLALALLWALNPYLGLRTTGSFTMFSNLRTEAPHSNHLFMPPLRIAGWQDEMVVLEASNDDQLADGAANRMALPMVALQRMSMDDPGLVVTGTIAGRTRTWGPHDGQTRFEPLPWWQYKLFLFRPVTTDGRPFCSQS